ncbi:MAG: XdhC family protein, partial [Acidimicrobiia bacterium]
LLGPTGPLAGTLGCSELDAQAVELAGAVLASNEPTLSTLGHDLGEVDAHLESYRPSRRLLVVSATPVALHLLRAAPALGYSTVLVEGRVERVTPEHRHEAGRVVTQLDEAGLGAAAAIAAVCTDHDAPGLSDLLAVLLGAGVGHLAVMGSARHTAPHLEALRSSGFDAGVLSRVRTPAGLDIGAQTPAEIALSILAGVVADRAGRDGLFLDRR